MKHCILPAVCVHWLRLQVKILQKGLQRSAQKTSFADRVDDIAELMDLLGRAVVMRDQQGVRPSREKTRYRSPGVYHSRR